MDNTVEECTYLLDNVDPNLATKRLHDYKASKIWFIQSEVGVILSLFVWTVLLFSEFTIKFIAQHDYINSVHSYIVSILIVLALWCHLKTMISDPGAVPTDAMPIPSDFERSRIRCGKCQCYKPPLAHHGNIF